MWRTLLRADEGLHNVPRVTTPWRMPCGANNAEPRDLSAMTGGPGVSRLLDSERNDQAEKELNYDALELRCDIKDLGGASANSGENSTVSFQNNMEGTPLWVDPSDWMFNFHLGSIHDSCRSTVGARLGGSDPALW